MEEGHSLISLIWEAKVENTRLAVLRHWGQEAPSLASLIGRFNSNLKLHLEQTYSYLGIPLSSMISLPNFQLASQPRQLPHNCCGGELPKYTLV